jgi:hypothetical protein
MNKEIETMIEPLEMVISEKPVIISLSTRLRNRSKGIVDEFSSTNELLVEAADEIDRLRAIIHKTSPVSVLKEIWKHHQPVYLFEAITDALKEKSHGLQ